MLTAFSASPSLDITYVVDDYRLGAIHRPLSVHRMAGGKALNAARAAAILGADVAALAILAGPAGAAVESGAREGGVQLVRIDGVATTRSCVSVASVESGELTEIYEHPVPVGGDEWASLLEHLRILLAIRPGWLIISGGMPAGLPADALDAVLRIAAEAGARVALDTHGPALAGALRSAALSLLKINREEAAEVLGCSTATPIGLLAEGLRRLTSGAVVVTDGIDGALGVDDREVVHASLAGHVGGFPVGSGDSFLGAMVTALDRGATLGEAMSSATGAATANALEPGAARFSRRQAESLASGVELTAAGGGQPLRR